MCLVENWEKSRQGLLLKQKSVTLFFKRFYLFISERGEGREKERERNINWLPLAHASVGDWTCSPSMCPDWESNWWPFALQDGTQPTEPCWPGPRYYFLLTISFQTLNLPECMLMAISIRIIVDTSFIPPVITLGMCPDRESNWQPVALQNDAPPFINR